MEVLCKNPECREYSEINEFQEDHVSHCGYCGHCYGDYGVNLEILAECKRLSDNYYDKWMWPTLILVLLTFFLLPITLLNIHTGWWFLFFAVAILAELFLIYFFIKPKMKKKFRQYHDQANN